MNQSLSRVWGLFTPTERRKAAWTLFLVIAMAAVETAGVVSILPFLSILGRPTAFLSQPWAAPFRPLLSAYDTREITIALGLLSMVLVICSSTFKTVTLHLVNRFVHLQRHSLSVRLLSRYLHQPYEFVLAHNPSGLAKNVLSEVDQIVFDVLQPLSQLIAQGSVVLAMVVLVVVYDPLMAACIIGAVTLLYGAIYLLARRRLLHTGQASQTANAERYKLCSEAFGGIKEVKVTGTADYFVHIFSKHSREFSRHTATAETLSYSPLYLVEAVGYSGLIAIALALLLRSNDLGRVLPAIGLYGFAAYRLLPAAQIMYRGFARLRFSSAALENINRDLDLPLPSPHVAGSAIVPKAEIRLQGVSYAYPAAPTKPVLDQLDLAVPAATSVAIAGRSGSGKSTLMDVLLGLLPPQTGTLSIDGLAINASNVANWQKSIGYVPQHIYLVDASVAENIAFGVPQDSIDMSAVERAARAAQIHDFVVNELPKGYMTEVGDRGIRLSGGQRQRIGIARALYGDPPVLLLDEATSALDAETEEAFNSVIHDLSGSKTVLVVAHKESALRSCNAIVRLPEHGTAATQGE